MVIGMSENPQYRSRYRAMVKTLRAELADESDCLYLLHTPIGVINVITWDYGAPGFVAVRGEDESKKYRFLIFSEEEICSFPLEIKRKKLQGSEETLGFKRSLRGREEEV